MRNLVRLIAAISSVIAFSVMPVVGSMTGGAARAEGAAASPICAAQPGDPGVVALATTLAPAPAVGAKAAAVISRSSGQMLYDFHGHERRAPASTTKIMTALVSLESIVDEGQPVVTTTDASTMIGSSVMGLWPSAAVSYRDLLYGLMLPSGNDAAIELARHLGPTETEFVARMNAKAAELGMADTHFANPHGLDESDHYSSAHDLAVLGDYAMANSRFREIAATIDYRLPPPFDYAIYNGNSILGTYEGATGIKIGWTDAAGWTFVASAARDGEEVIVALLDTPDRDADAAALLDWAFDAHAWQAFDASTLQLLDMLSAFSGVDLVARLVNQCAGEVSAGLSMEEG